MHGITTDGLSFTDADIAAIAHDCDFDPTCGYSIADLCAIAPPDTEPDDFADFWEDTYERAMLGSSVLALSPRYVEVENPPAGTRVWQVSYTAFGCVRIHADLREPTDVPLRGLIVHGHGYGGPGDGDDWARRGYASLQVHQRGFGRSEITGLPHGNAMRHVINGIQSRETYVIRGCVAEIWQAGSLLCHRYPELADRLFYEGGSFGGGIGALAVAWDRRLRGAVMRVPTFGHHPVRLSHRCRGSGEAVRRHATRLPELLETLPYFDAATAAGYITCPVHMAVAVFDPNVIPPGQFAVANAVRSAGSRAVILPADHFEPPLSLWSLAQRQAFVADTVDFLDTLLDA